MVVVSARFKLAAMSIDRLLASTASTGTAVGSAASSLRRANTSGKCASLRCGSLTWWRLSLSHILGFDLVGIQYEPYRARQEPRPPDNTSRHKKPRSTSGCLCSTPSENADASEASALATTFHQAQPGCLTLQDSHLKNRLYDAKRGRRLKTQSSSSSSSSPQTPSWFEPPNRLSSHSLSSKMLNRIASTRKP